MAVSSISSATTPQTPDPQNPRLLFMQLAKAIQSGDLSGAQDAYNALEAQGGGNPNSPFAQALSAIGTALQNNDIDGAKSALAQLQQQIQSAQHHHHHHRHSAPPQSDQAASTVSPATDTSTSASGNTVDVTA